MLEIDEMLTDTANQICTLCEQLVPSEFVVDLSTGGFPDRFAECLQDYRIALCANSLKTHQAAETFLTSSSMDSGGLDGLDEMAWAVQTAILAQPFAPKLASATALSLGVVPGSLTVDHNQSVTKHHLDRPDRVSFASSSPAAVQELTSLFEVVSKRAEKAA